MRTVTLARGSFTGSPPGSRPIPRSRASVERHASRFDSPDSGESSESLRLLGQVGIVEVLENDDRPTFVVDLADGANYGVSDSVHVLYSNKILKAFPGMLDAVSGGTEDESLSPLANKLSQSLKTWVLSASPSPEPFRQTLSAVANGQVSWTSSTIRKRLRIVRGTFSTEAATFAATLPSKSPAQPSPVSSSGYRQTPDRGSAIPSSAMIQEEPQDYFGTAALAAPESVSAQAHEDAVPRLSEVAQTTELPMSPDRSSVPTSTYQSVLSELLPSEDTTSSRGSTSYYNECVLSAATAADVDQFGRSDSPREIGFFDWTRLPMSESLPPHIHFARSVDWASTALGPIENWSADLRQMCNLIMASPHPAAMYWGPDLVAIYNEAYVLLAGQKHPKLMGQSYSEAWAEIWDDVKDVFAGAQLTGQATMKVGWHREAYLSSG